MSQLQEDACGLSWEAGTARAGILWSFLLWSGTWAEVARPDLTTRAPALAPVRLGRPHGVVSSLQRAKVSEGKGSEAMRPASGNLGCRAGPPPLYALGQSRPKPLTFKRKDVEPLGPGTDPTSREQVRVRDSVTTSPNHHSHVRPLGRKPGFLRSGFWVHLPRPTTSGPPLKPKINLRPAFCGHLRVLSHKDAPMGQLWA